MTSPFAALIAPLTPEEFGRRIAENRAFTIAGADTFTLLPAGALEELKHSNAIAPEDYYIGLRGGALPRAGYRASDGTLRTEVVDAFLGKGMNLVIDKVQRHVPAIAEMARSIGETLRADVNVNLYASFGAESVFHPHCDPHHVLAVQIGGAKRWRLYGRQTVSDGAVASQEILLDSGDVLFLPRGEFHDAVPVRLPSVHLTFGVTLPR